MGAKVEVPWYVGEALVARHGRDVYVVAKKDWNRIRAVARKHPKALKELKALGVVVTPVVIRGGQSAVELVAMRELARKKRRKA